MALLRAPDGSETIEVSDPAEIAHYQSLGATVVGSAESRVEPQVQAPNPNAELIAGLNAPHDDFMGMGMPPLGRLAGAVQGGPNLMQEAGSLVARGAGAVARGAGKLANAPILRRLPGTGMVRGMAKDAAEMAGRSKPAAVAAKTAASEAEAAVAAEKTSEAGRALAAHRWTKGAAEAPSKVAGSIKPKGKPRVGTTESRTARAKTPKPAKAPAKGTTASRTPKRAVDESLEDTMQRSLALEKRMKEIGLTQAQKSALREELIGPVQELKMGRLQPSRAIGATE